MFYGILGISYKNTVFYNKNRCGMDHNGRGRIVIKMQMSDHYWEVIMQVVKALELFKFSGVGEVLSEETNESVRKALEGICTDTCKLVKRN